LCRWKSSSSNGSDGRQRQNKQERKGSTASWTLIWRYELPSLVTSTAAVGSNLIVVGTNRGHVCLIDWTKRTKATLSFCHEHRPKVFRTWIPHEQLIEPKEDKSLGKQMGIMKMRVETSNKDCVVGKRLWGRCRVKWVTPSGWLLSMILDSSRIQDNCLVHYSSPELVLKNADGSIITPKKRFWSLPYNTIGVEFSNRVPACWIGTPTVTKVLSHHDKFVLDSQPRTIVSKEIMFMVQGIDDEIHNIPLPGIVKDPPQMLAVHPSLEWIVVGERRKLRIMVSSGRGTIRL